MSQEGRIGGLASQLRGQGWPPLFRKRYSDELILRERQLLFLADALCLVEKRRFQGVVFEAPIVSAFLRPNHGHVRIGSGIKPIRPASRRSRGESDF